MLIEYFFFDYGGIVFVGVKVGNKGCIEGWEEEDYKDCNEFC